jgi:tetratricopeptide (TPR) repeat protein
MPDFILILEKELEERKKEASELLTKEKDGLILLNENERENLKKIVAGKKFFGEDEKEKIEEILNLPSFSFEKFFSEPEFFLARVSAIEKVMGQATGFIYPLILITANNFQKVLEISSEINKIYFLIKEKFKQEFFKISSDEEYRLNLLTGLRDILLSRRPKITEKFLDFEEALIAYQKKKEIDFFSLLIIEAFILKKFNFLLKFLKREKDIFLEIKIDKKSLYWEINYPSLLSYVPIDFGLAISFFEFFSCYVNYYSSKIKDLNLALRNLEFLKKVFEHLKTFKIDDYFLTLKNLSSFYLIKEDLINAKKNAEVMCKIDPSSYEGYLLLGNILAKKGEYEEALKIYEKIFTLDLEEKEKQLVFSQIYCNQGYIYLNLNKLKEAIESFQKALELNPDYFEAYFNLGNAYFQNKKFDLAEKSYQKALKLNKKFPLLYFQLGRLYTEWNKKEKAVESYKKLITLQPNNYLAWYNLGLLYRDLGKKEEAAEYLEKAIRLNPNLGK